MIHITGTIFNVATIITGGFIGLLLGNRLPEKIRFTVMNALGLFTMAYGIKLFLQTNNAMVVLGSLLIGILLGEWWKLEDGLNHIGIWFESKFNKGNGVESKRFIQGFLTSSLLFCIGPMAILGALQDGLTGDFSTLAIKAVIDGFSAIAFASSMGVGVLFSSIIILVYQGGISLLANQLQFLMTDIMLNEISALGGIMLIGLAISSLMEIRKIRVANFLPGFLIVPFMVMIFIYFGIY